MTHWPDLQPQVAKAAEEAAGAILAAFAEMPDYVREGVAADMVLDHSSTLQQLGDLLLFPDSEDQAAHMADELLFAVFFGDGEEVTRSLGGVDPWAAIGHGLRRIARTWREVDPAAAAWLDYRATA